MKINKETFVPVGHLVFIKKLKERTKKQTQRYPVDMDDPKNKNKTEEEIKELEEVTVDIKLNQQLAEVISIGENIINAPYKKGDIVAYDLNSARDLDLISGTALLANHNIIGIIKES